MVALSPSGLVLRPFAVKRESERQWKSGGVMAWLCFSTVLETRERRRTHRWGSPLATHPPFASKFGVRLSTCIASCCDFGARPWCRSRTPAGSGSRGRNADRSSRRSASGEMMVCSRATSRSHADRIRGDGCLDRCRPQSLALPTVHGVESPTPSESDPAAAGSPGPYAFTCCEMYLFISNMVTLSLPKTFFSLSSARISRLFSGF